MDVPIKPFLIVKPFLSRTFVVGGLGVLNSIFRQISPPTTAQKMMFPIKDFFSKRDQIRSFLRIWSHLLKKSLMKNFIFCAVHFTSLDSPFTSILPKKRPPPPLRTYINFTKLPLLLDTPYI